MQGIEIEKRTLVHADVYSVHFNRDVWLLKIHVLFTGRHATKRHPMTYLPLGAGPRYCAVIRFALVEMKILLVRLLREYFILRIESLESKGNISEVNFIALEKI